MITIERLDDSHVKATYVRHLRTLTSSTGTGGNIDLDLYRLADGAEITCQSNASNCRITPREVEASAPVGSYS